MNEYYGKIHYFDIGIAKDIGIEEAIILQNISFWVDKNKANDRNKHDGKYWTYNSASALKEIFPYMSEYKINRVLNDLEDEGYIESGNYNKMKYDRTKWYTTTNKIENQQMHFWKSKMEGGKIKNGIAENQTPIPDSKPDCKTDNKTHIPYKEIFNYYIEKDNLVSHQKLTKQMKDSIKSAIKELSIGKDEIFKIIDKHNQLVGLTENKGQYKVRRRRLDDLFGQHTSNIKSAPLLCQEYLEGGKKHNYLEQLKSKKSKINSNYDNVPDDF